uniref:Beta-glucuronidase n=1 Tax=Timema shepardi TaxID=629360 RepID=A0A7R9ARH1_TIMSH|nr:unnamed protein product [Timema shepardi]
MAFSDNNPDPLLQLTTDTWADHSATNETTNPSLSHETRRPSYPDSSARDNLETELVRSLWPLGMSTTTTIYAYALLLLRSGVTLARISSGGILYPQESESRDVRTLDGVWNFRLSPESDPLVGFREHWYNKELRQTGETIPMPVPASYNDITQDKAIRDHVGLVWYDRSFFVPDTWRQQGLRVWMRFGSVSYAAQVVSWRTDIHCMSTIVRRISIQSQGLCAGRVASNHSMIVARSAHGPWVNGQLVMSHEIGHLPFQRDIASVLKYGSKNLVTVAVDNTLLETSIPQGQLSETYT